MKREKASESLSYWQQAKRFADASNGMPTEAAPLTIYYSFLNASKALLTYKKATFSQHH
ncbi:YaaC family protein, partial [Mycobacterium paragordonae]